MRSRTTMRRKKRKINDRRWFLQGSVEGVRG